MQNTCKIVKFDIHAREKLLEGVDILSDAVKITMGPRGRNVVIEQPNTHPILTKDGVTVARAINLSDPFANLGVQMIKEAASRTADVAGDGTTTATVLAHAIFSEGLKVLAAGYSAAVIKKGIDIATNIIIENLEEMSVPITHESEMNQISVISANGERLIGDLICQALDAVGKDGVVTVEEAKGLKSNLVISEGMQINRGYLSPYFVTNQDKMLCELDNPYILLTNKKVDSLKEIAPLLEKSLNEDASLLIVADDVDGDAMQGLVVNKMRGSLKICAIKAPGFGESRVHQLGDLATVLGCDVPSPASGETLKAIDLSSLGRCRKVSINKFATVFIGAKGNSESIEERSSSIRTQITNPEISPTEEQILRQRLASLAGGIAIIKVGGATESELRERKDRVDDSLHATQAAIEEGILPGGGVALVKAAHKIEKSKDVNEISVGIEIVKKACELPLKQIVENSGGTPDVVLAKVLEMDESSGYNAASDSYGNMFNMGIIDPLKVVRSALENAASAAGMMLTIGCAMIEDDQDSDIN